MRELALERRPPLPLSRLEEVAGFVADLASRRALAAYGFESEVGADEFRSVAPNAVKDAARVVRTIRAALGLVGRRPRARPP